MFKYWNGSIFNKSNGFDSWLKTRFKDLQGAGPNTWIVPEWTTPQNPTEIIKPQPWEVPAAWAHNFEHKNTVLQWLLVAQPIVYLKKQKAIDIVQGQENKGITVQTPEGYQIPFTLPEWLQNHVSTQSGYRYTLYTDTHAIVYERIDKDYYLPQSDNEQIIEIKRGRHYVQRVYEHKLGFVPAFRVGYLDDPKTAGRTKVPFWHRAKNTFKKSLHAVSQMDIAESIQNFPRPYRYVTQCTGTPEHACNKGFEAGNPVRTLCKKCSGQGVYTITNPAQEVIIPLPQDPNNENMVDLSKFTYWDTPPQAPFEHMMQVVKELEPRAHKAVWGTQMLVQIDATTKTATEDDNDQKRLQTALEPFAEHISYVYRFVGYLFGALAGADVNKMDVYYEFQGDLYRRGKSQLINQIKTATDAGAPSFIIEQINETLADISFAGDPYGRQKVAVQSYFWPFPGKSNAQIEFLFSSNLVEQFDQVLFTYFDAIFKELELDNTGFYYITDRNNQWELLEAKVAEFIERKKAETPEPVLPAIGQINVEETI